MIYEVCYKLASIFFVVVDCVVTMTFRSLQNLCEQWNLMFSCRLLDLLKDFALHDLEVTLKLYNSLHHFLFDKRSVLDAPVQCLLEQKQFAGNSQHLDQKVDLKTQ